MRRPAPLPAPAQEPAEVAPEARTGRRVRAGEQEPDARRAAEAAAGESGSAEAGIDAPVRSSDVWRAARARRRALRAEIRRFTQRSRRRRLVWWCSIGAVLALILGSVVAAYSPLFAVERITVAGARGVDAAAVQQALHGQIGSPLALIDQSAVKSALTQFPMIESYALEARPPHELLVRIVERTPVGVLSSDAGYSLVDAAGVVLATTEKKPDGQPVLSIDGGTSGAAFRSAGLVIRSLPADLRSQLKQVAATSADDVTLTLQDGRGIVWGSADESAQKAIVLVALMKGAPGGHTFDVSAPTVPVVR
jgi:cell division protein FtsQ